MKNLSVVIIALAGLALSPISVMADDTKPAKPKTSKSTKKKPCVDEAKPSATTGESTAGAAAVAAAPAASPAVDAVAAQTLAEQSKSQSDRNQ